MPGGVATFRLGRIDGVPVDVHFGFFVVAGLLSSSYWRSWRLSEFGLGVALTAILFVSVLAHEFAHAAVARRFKVGTRLIEINMSGSLAHRDGPAWSARENCLILLAGPLANLVIAAVAYAVFLALWSEPGVFLTVSDWRELIPDQQMVVIPELLLVRVLRLVVLVNVGLCVVNLLPAFPLDGGGLLFHLVSWRWGARTGTFVVGLVGICLSLVSVLFLIGTALSGYAILVPPRLAPNWNAVQDPARGHAFG